MALVLASLPMLCGSSLVHAQNGPFQFPDDHFLCYKGKADKSVGTILPKGTTASIIDQFQSDDYEIKKLRGICNPADTNGEGIVDPNTHLTPWQNKALTVAHVKQDVITFDQFGFLALTTVKPDRLLVPASKSLTQPPPWIVSPPVNFQHDVDHYQCYKAKVSKGAPKFPKGLQATIDDQFPEPARVFDLKKPALICNPADKNGEGIKNPDGHLVCYQAKPAKGQPKHEKLALVQAADQFVSELAVATSKEDLLCVPALKNPPDQFCGDGTVNQPSEECDASDIAGCAAGEFCSPSCICTTCGNGLIDAGETCELDSDCLATERCNDCQCEFVPPVGARTFSFGPSSEFTTNLVDGSLGSLGTPSGTFELAAGIPNDDGVAPLTMSTATIVQIDILLASTTVCYEFVSCTGELFCDGGFNAEVEQFIDSLAVTETSCVQDGTGQCDPGVGNACCSNSCEGLLVTSGNPLIANTGIGGTDSGPGSAYMVCTVRTRGSEPLGTDCTTLDYSSAPVYDYPLSTTRATARVDQHCANELVDNTEVMEYSISNGENFDCSDFSTPGVGRLLMPIPGEEPNPTLPGDSVNAIMLADD